MPVDIQTMLVATDFSEASVPATTYAFSLARTLQAHLYLLHVVPEEDVRIIRAISSHLQSDIAPEALVETFYVEARKRLASLVEGAQAADVVQERLIMTGHPATTIRQVAEEKHVQLLVIGTHGRSGVTRFLMGSVAEQVLREAPCAVVVVPSPSQ